MKLREIDMGAAISTPDYTVINANGQCVTHILMVELGKYDNSPIKKLCINMQNREDKTKLIVMPDNIGIVEIAFDFANYWQLTSSLEKKMALLDVLYKGVIFAAKELSLDIKPFKDAKNRMLANSIYTEFAWGKAKWNALKNLKAEVFYRFNMEDIEIGIQIYSKSGDIVQEKILEKTMPHFMFVSPYLGQLKWSDHYELELISKDKQETLRVSLNHQSKLISR